MRGFALEGDDRHRSRGVEDRLMVVRRRHLPEAAAGSFRTGITAKPPSQGGDHQEMRMLRCSSAGTPSTFTPIRPT